MGVLSKLGAMIRLAGSFAQLEQLNKQGAALTKYLPILITIIGTVSGAVAFPDFVAHHATVFAVLAAIGQGLHAALPSIFGETKQ